MRQRELSTVQVKDIYPLIMEAYDSKAVSP